MKENKTAAFSYLELALGSFAGIGIEAVYAFVIEPAIYGVSMERWSVVQNIVHWTIVCITWGTLAYLLLASARKKHGFNIREHKGKLQLWQCCIVIGLVALSITVSYLNWDGFKVIKEYNSNGMPKFAFQIIYYFFETALFTLIIAFGQKAFEKLFHRENVPFGGMLLAMTWGLAHIFTKGSLSTGLVMAASGIAYGIVYLLLNRDIRKAYLALCVMFIL